ncbi:MFS transporter [Streptomyces sp. NPDC048383]|uniref:MFS transporter n=1 Tax=Streptomyces sp. NPDC048383 TaxID=3155386 RepID=UPI003425FB91
MAHQIDEQEHTRRSARGRRTARLVSSRFGGLPPGFGVLWSSTLINRAGTFIAPFLIIYLTEYHQLPLTSTTPILIGYGVGVMLSSPLGGVLADRIGRRHTMAAGLSMAAVCQVFIAVAHGSILIGAAVFLLGLVGDIFRPAANALVADSVPESDQTRAYGLLHWALNLGMPVAAVGAGWFSTHSWTLLFLIDALSSLVCAVLVLTRLPSSLEMRKKPASRQSPPDRGKDAVLSGVCLLTLMSFFLYFQTSYAVPLQVLDSGLRPSDYGVMMAVNGIFVAVVQPLVGPWLSVLPKAHAIGSGALLIGTGLFLTGQADTLWLLLVAVALWSVGEIALAALLPSLVAGLAPTGRRGRYMGAFGACIGAAGVAAPLGTMAYHPNPTLFWGLCLALGAAIWPGAVLLLRASAYQAARKAPTGSELRR